MAEALPLEKLRTFLRALNPEARALLLAEIERAEQRGEPIPAAEFLLRELRGDTRPSGREADRAAMPARLFFAPLEPWPAPRPCSACLPRSDLAMDQP